MSGVQAVDTVPPGQHAPFAPVTPDDHRAWIIIAAAMGIAFVTITLLTRVVSRRFMSLAWAFDDTMTAVATVVFFVQSSLVLAASADGLGKSIHLIPASERGSVQELYYTSNIFYIFALDLAKLASLLFFWRLTMPKTKLRTYSTILGAILPVITVAFVLATSLQCDLLQPWVTVGERCPGWIARWDVQGAVSSLYEVALFMGPVWLAWDLQRPWDVRIEVLTPFALRLIIIPLTIVRLTRFNQSGLSTDPTLLEARYIYWTQIELSYGVIAATFPAARRLAVDMITYYNGGSLDDTIILSRDRTTRNHSTRQRSTRNRSTGNDSESHHLKPLRPHILRRHGSNKDKGKGTVDDSDPSTDQELIIRKDVTVEVEHETRDPDLEARGSSSRAFM